jgi:hypothetical protein
MVIRLNAEDEPAKTRVDYWQHVMGSSLAPYQIRAAAGSSVSSWVHYAQIGPVAVLDVYTSAGQAIRTPALIRDSDSGMCKIDLGIRGRGRYEQDGRQSLLAPGDFHLIDFSRPSSVAIEAAQEVSIVMFPRELLPARDAACGSCAENRTAVRSRRSPRVVLPPVVPAGIRRARHRGRFAGSRDLRPTHYTPGFRMRATRIGPPYRSSLDQIAVRPGHPRG